MENKDETDLYVSECLNCLSNDTCPICKQEINDLTKMNTLLKVVLFVSFIVIQINIIYLLFYYS
jgi:hypothetical protein